MNRQSQPNLLDELGVGDGAVELLEHPFADGRLVTSNRVPSAAITASMSTSAG
jgi:hypothetical protein